MVQKNYINKVNMAGAKKLLAGIALFLCFVSGAQDTLKKNRLKLFDINVSGDLTGFKNSFVSKDMMLSYIHNEEVKAEAQLYAPKDGDAYEQPVGFGFGVRTSFKFMNNKYLKRIKPRVSLCAYQVDYMLGYKMIYQDTFVITSAPVPPNPSPIYLDSVNTSTLTYKYSGKMVLAETGANFDFIVRESVIFYSGILVGYGRSVKNELTVTKYERCSVENVPGSDDSWTYTDLNRETHRYTENAGSVMRITVPFGLQYRFGTRDPDRIGVFGEFRLGMEKYKIDGGITSTRFIYPLSVGIRFNFMYHK